MNLRKRDWGFDSPWIGCTKFYYGCTKFTYGCTQGSKVYSEKRNDLQSLSKGTQKIKWTMRKDIGVPIAQQSNIPNFLKDVPRVPKFVLRWGMTSNHFQGFLKDHMDHEGYRSPDRPMIGCTKFSKNVSNFLRMYQIF